MRQYEKSWSALIVPSSALIVPLPVKRYPNKLATNIPNSILRNMPCCSFALFLTVSLNLFVNKSNSSRDLTIWDLSFISSFKMINVVLPGPSFFFLWVAASVGNAAAVKPNGIKTLLASGLSIFSNKSQFLVIVLKVQLEILLIVQFFANEFLIISY